MTEYIDREALYEKAYWHGEHPDVGNPFPDGVDAIDIKDVDAIPAADVAPVVHGHFVHDGPRFAGGVDWWHCSNCGRLASGVETHFDYCPKCGARMDGGADKE